MKAAWILASLALLTGCTPAQKKAEPAKSASAPTPRQSLAQESPSLQKVLAIDPHVRIHHYFNDPPESRWQIIGDINVFCSDGGYGPTIEDAARQCLTEPRITQEDY
jgi:hypothetical protein